MDLINEVPTKQLLGEFESLVDKEKTNTLTPLEQQRLNTLSTELIFRTHDLATRNQKRIEALEKRLQEVEIDAECIKLCNTIQEVFIQRMGLEKEYREFAGYAVDETFDSVEASLKQNHILH